MEPLNYFHIFCQSISIAFALGRKNHTSEIIKLSNFATDWIDDF